MPKRIRTRRLSGPNDRESRPTAPTARKRQYDGLYWLFRKGSVSAEQFEAGVAIRETFEVMTRGSQGPRAVYGQVTMPSARKAPRPTGYDRAREIDLQRWFRDWSEAMTTDRLPIGPVFDVVVDGRSCNSVDSAWRVRKGTTRALLCEALNLYCRIRGWAVAA